MEKDQIFFLKDRGVIYINGSDAKDFLQNIVTNDINKVTDTSSCFASLLTPQGKYLFDFIIVKHKNGYFLDCEKKQADKLVDRLNIYKLNSDIEILNLSNEFEVAVISKNKFISLDGTKNLEGNTIRYNDDLVVLDPRSKELGGRIIANSEKLTLSIKNLQIQTKISDKEKIILKQSWLNETGFDNDSLPEVKLIIPGNPLTPGYSHDQQKKKYI